MGPHFLENLSHLEINWETFKTFLLILMGISAAILVIQGVFLFFTFILPFGSVVPASVEVPEISTAKLEPIESFQKKWEARHLFFATPKAAVPAQTLGIEDKVRELSLIGLVSTGEPEAIVKDTRLGQTYFLKKGQKVRDMQVKEVRKNSIVLKSGKEEKEIFID